MAHRMDSVPAEDAQRIDAAATRVVPGGGGWLNRFRCKNRWLDSQVNRWLDSQGTDGKAAV